MLKQFANFISIILASIALISHILKLIYLLFKPSFMSRIKYFSEHSPSKTDLAMYYILTIGCCYYVLFNYFK